MNTTLPGIISIEQTIRAIEGLKDVLSNNGLESFQLPPSTTQLNKWIKQLERQRTHSSQRYTMMVLGEYNAGKSTMLNALLDLPNNHRLPAKDEPTNAVPIRITRRTPGDPEVLWCFADGQKVSKSWQEGTKAATQQHRIANLEEVKVYLDHPLLIYTDILDMPGTGTAWYQDHTETTRSYISNAELIVWVIGSEEPSREGMLDYKEVKRHNVSKILVFNAWGYLNPDRDALHGIDQDAIENSVRQSFPELFEAGSVFRVFSNKALEQMDRGDTKGEDYGFKILRDYLQEKYLGEFTDRAQIRRENVIKQVNRISKEIELQLIKDLEDWDNALDEQQIVTSTIRNMLDKQILLQRQVAQDIRKLSRVKARTLLGFISSQAEIFINDTLVVENFKLVMDAVKHSRESEKLKDKLVNDFKNKYLDWGNPHNWFIHSIEDLTQECWIVLDAHWQQFLQEISVDLENVNGRVNYPRLPGDQLLTSALGGISSLLLQAVGIGGVLAMLALIPGGAVIDAVAVIAAGVLATIHDPFAKHRQSAIRRFRNESDMQEDALSNELSQYILKQLNEPLLSQFNLYIASQNGQQQTKVQLLLEGKNAIQELQFLLAESESNVAKFSNGEQ